MKDKKTMKLSRALGEIDEELIAKAAPTSRRKRKAWIGWVSFAACFALVASLGLWLFLPFGNQPPSVERHENSSYYPIIKRLNVITYRGSSYENKFDQLFGGWFGGGKDDLVSDGVMMEPTEDAAPPPEMVPDSGVTGTYEEITDNQVEGVIEADRIKRSDKHIFYLNGSTVEAYTIAGLDSEKIGGYSIQAGGQSTGYESEWEFYLSEDCTRITVLMPYYNNTLSCVCLSVISLDVTDPTAITEVGRVELSGNYLSSRLVDGKLLVMTNFSVRNNPDFNCEEQFLPQIDAGEGRESIPAEDIYYPDVLTDARYTVVCRMDEHTLAVEDSAAFLSYSNEVYVSAEHIFASRTYNQKTEEKEWSTNRSMTEVLCLSYVGEKFERLGSVTLEGYLKDQYSMDEYEGILRVVTTTSVSQYRETQKGDTVGATFGGSYTSASLYCVSLSDFSVRAKVQDFAPKGETVQSARFDRDTAYVCTAIKLTDPVFFFDLSDLDHITYKETGTIEGYSSSLVNLRDGYLLGIGVGNVWSTLKIEVYEETADGVESVCKYELKDTYFSSDYKSYYIDRDQSLMGLGVTHRGETEYLLLFFDGYALRELARASLDGVTELMRAVCIDDYLYLFGEEFKVLPIV